MPLEHIMILLATGIVAGILGGLLGIGGSVIMIPVIALLLDGGADNQARMHLAMAAALIVNLCVAIPSVIRHHRKGAVRWDIIKRVLPVSIIFIIIGALLSNTLDGTLLMRLFGVFLIYVLIVNIRKMFGIHHDPPEHQHREKGLAPMSVGGIMGFASGLLGIGGGIVAVPLFQRICNLPLRNAIACSSALMCLTVGFGAVVKNAGLPQQVDQLTNEPMRIADSLIIAACLAPTAIIASYLGAGLTHTLPIKAVRAVFILLVAIAAYKMLGIDRLV